MAEALLLLATFAAAYGGFLCLALSQQRHWRVWLPGRQLTRPAQWALRAPGAGLLALLRDGPSFGSLLWATAISLAALGVAFSLSWQPRWLRPLACGMHCQSIRPRDWPGHR